MAMEMTGLSRKGGDFLPGFSRPSTCQFINTTVSVNGTSYYDNSRCDGHRDGKIHANDNGEILRWMSSAEDHRFVKRNDSGVLSAR